MWSYIVYIPYCSFSFLFLLEEFVMIWLYSLKTIVAIVQALKQIYYFVIGCYYFEFRFGPQSVHTQVDDNLLFVKIL